MAAATHYVASITWRDKENKPTTTSFNVVNGDATAYWADPSTGLIRAAFDALDAMSQGAKDNEQVSLVRNELGVVLPTDDMAYRQSKLVFSAEDTANGRPVTLSIGVRDPAAYNTTNLTKNVIMANAAGGGTAATAAFITAIEAVARSVAGNLIHLIGGKAEGRSI